MTARRQSVAQTFEYMLNLGDSASVMVHGLTREQVCDLLIDSEIDAIKTELRDGSDTAYLVGSVKVGAVDFTVFSDSYPVGGKMLEAVTS